MATILIVDDQPTNRDFLVTLLGYAGHRMLEAADGAEALKIVRAERPDLVIADLLMPTMDGYEFVRLLRADPEIEQTRVIYYTATYHESAARALARKCGVFHFITKPCEPEAVLRVVNEALGTGTDAAHRAVTQDFNFDHLRLVTDKLSAKVQELEAANHRLGALNALGRQLALERDPVALLESFCDAGRDIVGVKYAALGVLDDDWRTFRHFLTRGLSPEATARLDRPSPGGALLDQIIKQSRPLRLSSPQAAADWPVDLPLPAPQSSLMGVPVASPTRLYGVLLLVDRLASTEFTEEDEAVAEALAAQAAVGYENLRQFKDIQRHARLLEEQIAERIKAEQELHAARDAAEAANRAKDQFLARLSHELRTPLTPVLMTVSALVDDPATPSSVRPALEMTRRNVELEKRLIDDLLDLTRITTGRLQLDRAAVNAHTVIEQAVEICRGDIADGGHRLTLELMASSPFVSADAARLQQVFWNLIKNAVKFTPHGGQITVRTRNRSAGPGGAEADWLVVDVADTGVGLEPEVLGKLFQPFQNFNPPQRRRLGGLGLGLAISRSVAEAHGGRISAASAGPGQGSTFTFELPTVPAPATAGQPAAAPRPPVPSPAPRAAGPLRILLVEDNKDTLRSIAMLLRMRKHEVTTAERLETALAAADAGTFDLILSDIELPDGSGLDLMRHVQATRPVPGIAMSGFGTDDDIQASQGAGFREHITKPLNFQRLEAAILEITSGERSSP